MIESIFSVKYLLDIICIAVAFFTFIKLISNDVYLTNHRILPTIAGIITIYNFYICIIPFVRSGETVAFLHLLCDMCSLVTVFMMFFYFLFIKRPRHVAVIITLSVAVMISLCIYNFVLFSMKEGKSVNADIVAVLFVFIACLYVESIAPSKSYFDRTDLIIGRYMMLAFVLAMAGYLFHDYFGSFDRTRSIVFLLDDIIFYWLAKTNRIEDTGTILKSTIFDRMESPIALVNSDFYVIDANEKAMELFPSGKEIGFAFDGGNSKGKFTLGETLVKRGRNDAEYYAGDKWYRVHYKPVAIGDETKGYIFSASDITEQHYEATNAKRETAKKSQFLAQMSHELRSPLHAILGISDILGSKKDISEKNKNLITHIKRASENLLELVNAILDYSRLEAGKFEFSERVYDINMMFEDLAYSIILNLQSKPIDFNLAITTDYPRYVYGDYVRVREIFQNLLSNAVKFTEKGTIHGEITFEQVDDKQKISFSITDTGRGMTPTQIQEIFREYVSTADGETTEGTGLGLAIVKQIVSKLDGKIIAESDGLTGSTFKGYFYQKTDESEMLPERVLNRRNLMNQGTSLRGLPDRVDFIYPKANILVADDMRINLEIMQQLLEPWKCEVLTVPDGSTAVQAAKDGNFDLILLDQMMLPVSGPEACRQIREFSNVPIVLVTANSEENAREIVKESGFSDYLGKPILGVKLKDIIETYLPTEKAEPATGDTVISVVKRNRQSTNIYQRTLEAFVKEMQPLLLNLPNYRKNDKEMFKVKVHGIAGVSKQIGRDTFAESARVMEMAAKSETWNYVDEHLDEFLNNLCDVVEDATKELSRLAPEDEIFENDEVDLTNVDDILNRLYDSFDEYDLSGIEVGLEEFAKVKKSDKLNQLFKQLTAAYDQLEYEDGVAALEAFGLHSND